MLLSVNILDFRSCHSAELSGIDNMLVLIGRNGVGKTNILKAIEWAGRVATVPSALESAFEHRLGSVTLRVRLADQIFRYDVRLVAPRREESPGPQDVPLFLREKLSIEQEGGAPLNVFVRERGEIAVGSDEVPLKVGPLSPAAPAILALLPEHTYVSMIERFTDFLSKVKYYPLQETEIDTAFDLVPDADYETWRTTGKGYKDVNREIVLKILELKLTREEDFSELLALLGESGLDLLKNISVQSFNVPVRLGVSNEVVSDPKTTKYHYIQFAPSGRLDNAEFSFSQLSFGTRRVVRLLTYLFYDKANVSLIEQPEDGIHTGLLHKLIPILRSYADGRQFIITSHSSHVLNRMEPNEVRLVDIAEGLSTVRALSPHEIDAAKSFMENDGPLSDYLESMQEL